MKDLCKPCSHDSDCDGETSCSVAAKFPDSPLDSYCIPRDQPTFSCLKSSDALDYPQTVGMGKTEVTAQQRKQTARLLP
jgi:hypothetical protein